MAKQASVQEEIICIVLVILMTVMRGMNGQYISYCDVVVAEDGSGDFKTITEAIQHLDTPKSTFQRLRIKVKAGIYNENIIIEESKINLTLIGDGIDRTIISGSRSNSEGISTSETATVVVNANGFVAQDITFQNTAGPEAKQAVALLSKSNFSVYFRCKFDGYQDTLYASHGIQFYKSCEIYGTVDFIFGDARAVFQNCKILARKPPHQGQPNTITAQGRKSQDGDGGFVFHNCIITAAFDLVSAEYSVQTYLGRPWGDYSRTVIMQSYIDSVINPMGWLEWEGYEARMNTLYYAEFENRGIGAIHNSRVDWPGYKVLYDVTEAVQFTVRSFIYGDLWIPLTEVPYIPDLIEMSTLTIIGNCAKRVVIKTELIMAVTASFYLRIP